MLFLFFSFLWYFLFLFLVFPFFVFFLKKNMVLPENRPANIAKIHVWFDFVAWNARVDLPTHPFRYSYELLKQMVNKGTGIPLPPFSRVRWFRRKKAFEYRELISNLVSETLAVGSETLIVTVWFVNVWSKIRQLLGSELEHAMRCAVRRLARRRGKSSLYIFSHNSSYPPSTFPL